MPNRIIIIHPALLIREGLSSLLKGLFKLEALVLPGLLELLNYRDIKGENLIFLVDSIINKEEFESHIEHYNLSNSTKIILIRDRSSLSECEDNCNCCFYTDASKEDLRSLIKPFLDGENKIKQSNNQSGLTEREIDVLKNVAFGKTNKEMAEHLCISIHTVISHRKNITEKLGIKSISGLTVYAILNNLIDANTIDPESLI